MLISIIYVGVLDNRLSVFIPRDLLKQSVTTSAILLFIVLCETHANIFTSLTTTTFIHLTVWLQFLLVFTFHAYLCTLFWEWRFLVCPDKNIYYVTCFLVMVFCNECQISILTQLLVSYFCFLTSESFTISCWRNN